MRKIIIAALLALAPSVALAQQGEPGNVKGAPLKLPTIPRTLPGVAGPQTDLSDLLLKPFHDLAQFISDDVDGAIALSTSIPEVQDGHGQQCLMALKTFGAIFKAHPAPLTFKAATDLEALRLFQIAANNLCGNPHCTQVFADLATTVQVAAPVNVSIPIPSLHDLCSKVPQIAVVPPVTVPAVPAVPK